MRKYITRINKDLKFVNPIEVKLEVVSDDDDNSIWVARGYIDSYPVFGAGLTKRAAIKLIKDDIASSYDYLVNKTSHNINIMKTIASARFGEMIMRVVE